MGIPIIEGLRELDSAPRRFLLFIVFNVVSWQCIAGGALVLFAREIGMRESLVGFLLAFMPLSMVLVILTGRLVTRWGPKPVMLWAWALRNIIACLVFLMPWAMARWGVHAGWWVLLAATLGFCLMRSVGAGGWLPWLHEVVPGVQRGTYFSSEAMVTQFLSVLLSAGIAVALLGDPGINRYLAIYGVGIASGLFSLAWMFRVPGGHAIPRVEGRAPADSLKAAVSDRTYLRFVVTASLCFSSFSWLGASSVLYMRDVLGLSWQIMAFQAAASMGVLLTVRSWARYSDQSGSGRTMALALAGHSMAAAAFLTLLPNFFLTPVLIVFTVVMAAVFSTAYWVASNRAMLNMLPASCRVGYSNLWTVCTNVAMGITPIVAGFAIDGLGPWGYRICFVISAVMGIGCGIASLRAVRDGRPLEPSLSWLINPALPLRTLMRIVWICLGLHESRRPALAPAAEAPSTIVPLASRLEPARTEQKAEEAAEPEEAPLQAQAGG